MSPKLICHQNWNVTKIEMLPKPKGHKKWNDIKTVMSPKWKCHQNWNATKTKMLSKLKCTQNWNVTTIEISPKLNCQKNWNVTKLKYHKTEMSQKLNCHQNWNVIKTKISPKLKWYQNCNVTKSNNVLKIKIKIQEIDPDYLGLVTCFFTFLSLAVVVACLSIQPSVGKASDQWRGHLGAISVPFGDPPWGWLLWAETLLWGWGLALGDRGQENIIIWKQGGLEWSN